MALAIDIIQDGEVTTVMTDSFFESLLYRHIIDSDLALNKKGILLFIARKTIGFQKLEDNIGFQEFTWNLTLSEKTLRRLITQLSDERLLIKQASKGGQSNSRSRYSSYRLGNVILSEVVTIWKDIKDNNKFDVEV